MRSTAQAVTPEDVMTVSNDWITARTPRNQVRGDLIVAKGHPSKAFYACYIYYVAYPYLNFTYLLGDGL